MTILGKAQTVSTATPSAFFAIWGDMATWPQWNKDTEWVTLDGPFTQGATGKLKPKGGPTTKFIVASLIDGKEFVDVSYLLGARLTFDHQVTTLVDGNTRVSIEARLEGPLTPIWKLILGKGIANSLQSDLDNLKAVAEGRDHGLL